MSFAFITLDIINDDCWDISLTEYVDSENEKGRDMVNMVPIMATGGETKAFLLIFWERNKGRCPLAAVGAITPKPLDMD